MLRQITSWIVVVILSYVVVFGLFYWSASVYLPNGARLSRSLDLAGFPDRLSRYDLYRDDGWMRFGVDVEALCWNDAAFWGWDRTSQFIWLGPGHTFIRSSGADFDAALSASGLNAETGGCGAFYQAMSGPGLIFDGFLTVRPDLNDPRSCRAVSDAYWQEHGGPHLCLDRHLN